MSIWKYICEFLLFRWLLGSHNHNDTKQNLSNTATSSNDYNMTDDTDSHIGYGSRYDNSSPRYYNQNCDYSQSYDDFHEEQDDYDMMDDF